MSNPDPVRVEAAKKTARKYAAGSWPHVLVDALEIAEARESAVSEQLDRQTEHAFILLREKAAALDALRDLHSAITGMHQDGFSHTLTLGVRTALAASRAVLAGSEPTEANGADKDYEG